MPTPPPIELPMMSTDSSPSASTNVADGALRGDHRVTAEVIAHAEAGELQNQAAEMLGERAENAAEVAPSGHAGA